MEAPRATADDLYGDLMSVPQAQTPVPPPPLQQPPPPLPPDAGLATENAVLRARVAALETEARVWAAQRAVLVANLGALLRTAKAVDARRLREIRSLRDAASGGGTRH
jgi:hypothetical protein